MTTPRMLVVLVALTFCAPPLAADDWPQFRGPNRDDVSKEKGLLKAWPKDGPKLLWTFEDAGVGYSGPAVVGDQLFLTGGRKGDEYLFALDLKVGPPKEQWKVKLGKTFTFDSNSWGDGPRATPTVDGDRVYALGGFGELVCVNKATGEERWRVNFPKDLGGEVNPIGGGPEKLGWGWSWAPLIDGDRLICMPGGPKGTLAALDKMNGHVLWRSEKLTEQASYSSPIVAEIGKIRQYIILTNGGLAGIDAAKGELLWTYKKKNNDVVIPTPIFHDDHVYYSLGHGSAGCDLVKISADGKKFTATPIYDNNDMKNTTGGVVLVGDALYGSSGLVWTCMDFKSGEVKWTKKVRKFGAGSLTYADGFLYCYDEENGTVALVEADPAKAWVEKGRFEPPKKAEHAPRGKFWTHPVVANGRLYLRDQELLFCYEVK
jgi:outer membrane protein assembly factor BamB